MELTNILIIVSLIVFVLLIWGISGFLHLKHLRTGLLDQWDRLDKILRKRQDVLPNVIETVRIYTREQETLLKKMIEQRLLAAHEKNPNAKKIEYEYDLTENINKVIDLGKTLKELGADTNFLELKKEINDLEENLEEENKKYNDMLRVYNRHRKMALLRPIVKIFRFGSKEIFEVEV